LSLGSHTITFYGSDGFLEDSDSININIIEDPIDLPPAALILSPTQGTEFYADLESDGIWFKNVTLQGNGTDPEDGTLSGSSLVWRDKIDDGVAQVIGNGNMITVPLSAVCTATTHTISLEVTDSSGNQHTAQITIILKLFC
jgi:hypothetical protein